MASNYGEEDMSKRKPSPEILGTGGARKAADAIEKRKAQNCEAYGGMYDFAAHKCREK